MHVEESYLFVEEIAQYMQPIYVIREKTKEIVAVNDYLHMKMGRDITGELCYHALAGRERICSGCPSHGRPGERYVWERYCTQGNCLCKICNYWLTREGETYRIGIIEDVSDIMDLSRYAVNYLSLMTELSEMQADIMENQDMIFPIILRFLKKQFQGSEVIVTYPQEIGFKLFRLNQEDVIEERWVTGEERELADIFARPPEPVQVLENIYEFRIALGREPEVWEENKKIVFDVIKLYLENAVFREEIDWEVKHDRGTKLYNRAHFMHQSKNSYAQLASVGILYLDIDGLKQVNDQQGHAAGDVLIAKAAEILTEISQEQIHAYRMGGDEFVVVLCGCREGEVPALADTIREKAVQSNKETDGPKLILSMGYKYGEKPFSIEELVKKADAAMYEEKRSKNGRREAENEKDAQGSG